MSTIAQLLVRTRRTLEEVTENEFSDNDQLIPYLNDGIQFVAHEMHVASGGAEFARESTITTDASTEAKALTARTVRIMMVEWLATGNSRVKLPKLSAEQQVQYRLPTAMATDGLVPGYFMRGSNIHVLPIATVARTLYVTNEYEPERITSGDVETPDRYDAVVCLFAAIRAAQDDRQDTSKWEATLAALVANLRHRETQRANSDEVATVEPGWEASYFGA